MLGTYEMARKFFGGGHWFTRFYDMPIFGKSFGINISKCIRPRMFSLKYVVHQDKAKLFFNKAVWVSH